MPSIHNLRAKLINENWRSFIFIVVFSSFDPPYGCRWSSFRFHASTKNSWDNYESKRIAFIPSFLLYVHVASGANPAEYSRNIFLWHTWCMTDNRSFGGFARERRNWLNGRKREKESRKEKEGNSYQKANGGKASKFKPRVINDASQLINCQFFAKFFDRNVLPESSSNKTESAILVTIENLSLGSDFD